MTHIVGIKCDAPGCGWKNMTFEWKDVEAEVKTWLNHPCPQMRW